MTEKLDLFKERLGELDLKRLKEHNILRNYVREAESVIEKLQRELDERKYITSKLNEKISDLEGHRPCVEPTSPGFIYVGHVRCNTHKRAIKDDEMKFKQFTENGPGGNYAGVVEVHLHQPGNKHIIRAMIGQEAFMEAVISKDLPEQFLNKHFTEQLMTAENSLKAELRVRAENSTVEDILKSKGY